MKTSRKGEEMEEENDEKEDSFSIVNQYWFIYCFVCLLTVFDCH